jgi:uncharacterized membrane protein YfhO
VDGAAAEIERVNFNLRAVRLAAGEHEVSFVYRPPSFYAGASLSLLTLIGLLVWIGQQKRPAQKEEV